MQRKAGRVGKGLVKPRLIHKRTLEKRGVNLLGGVSYNKLMMKVCTLPLIRKSRCWMPIPLSCAGQVSVRPFEEMWQEFGGKLHVIGGADYAGES